MEPEKKSNGAFVGLVIIIIILVVGGICLWQSNKKVENQSPLNSETAINQDSADLDALNQELDVTDIDIGANMIDSIQ